jgi:hypothetical protein
VRVERLTAGFDDHLTKPVDIGVLAGLLAKGRVA